MGHRIIRNCLVEAFEFFDSPESHRIRVFTSHTAAFARGIGMKPAVFDRIVENSGKLIVYCFKIGILVAFFHKLRLPSSDSLGLYVFNVHFPEIRKQIFIEQKDLSLICRSLKPDLAVLKIQLCKVLEGQVLISVGFVEVVTFILFGFLLRFEAAFLMTFCFSVPVLVAELCVPCAVFCPCRRS